MVGMCISNTWKEVDFANKIAIKLVFILQLTIKKQYMVAK